MTANMLATRAGRTGPSRCAAVRMVLTTSVLALGAAGLSGCGTGTSEPNAASLTASPACRQAAADLLSIARTTRHSSKATDLAARLTPPQRRLLALPDAASVQPITTAIGFLRIRTVANTFTDDLRTTVRTATQQMIDRCSGRSAS